MCALCCAYIQYFEEYKSCKSSMSFICVICRDLLKISEEDASPQRHQQQQLLLPNCHTTTNHNASAASNNGSGGRRKGKSNSIVATKCGHLFHYPCLSVWMSQSMNLTTDSKMRCPSCKQLIYIYELIQLFPVETGGGPNKDLEQLFSAAFQQKLKAMLEHLENLCRDLSKKNKEMSSPLKGNETPTRLQRVRDSPKKSQSQLAQLMKETDSLRCSIKELNSLIEQHAELGSVVEMQTKQISELRSKNEQLILANERLKSADNENEKEALVDNTVLEAHNCNADSLQKNTQKEEDSQIVHADADEEFITRTAQDSTEGNLMNTTHSSKTSIMTDSSSPISNNSRRKSVTFLDPFEEFDDGTVTAMTTTTIPFETKGSKPHFRVGDKVVWNFEGNPEIGTVKWKGFIGSQINVGVEFERQLGIPIKDLSSDALQCIFKFKPGHGRLIPVQEVVLYNKEMIKKYELANSNYPADRFEGCKTSTNGINKRIQLCTHQ